MSTDNWPVRHSPADVTAGARRLQRLLTYVPLAIGLALLAKGVVQLLWVSGAGYDLRLRWSESQYYLHGMNPFPPSFYHDDVLKGVAHGATPPHLASAGWPEEADYPPTSTLTQLLLYGWPMAATRGLYVMLNVAGALAIVWRGPALLVAGGARRVAVGGLALANLGFSQTIINGNYGILVMSALLFAWMLRARRPALAGILLGVALVKPTMSLPFLVLFLVDRRYSTVAVCSAYLALSAIVSAALTRTAILTLTLQALEGSARFATGGYSLWQVVRAAGASQPVALAVNAAVFFAPFILLAPWRRARAAGVRDEAWLPWLAAAGVVARLFTYHNSIDNVLLVFLVLALSQRSLAESDGVARMLTGAVVASVLIPSVLTRSAAAQVVLYSLWIAAAVYALRVAPTRGLAELGPQPRHAAVG